MRPSASVPLPRFPERIGLVTSPTGAALRDVAHVLSRRQPSLRVLLAPCRVQGQGAAEEIAEAIRLLNRYQAQCAPADRLALVLVTRGGGSLEDLWAFNEEAVARAIFESALPVVSAVGHEIDFTISDFVADCRAATPSAAAEVITQDAVAARQFVLESLERLPRLARDQWHRHHEEVSRLEARLLRAHPRRRINEAWQRLDDLRAAAVRAGRFQWRQAQSRWETLRAAWQRQSPAQRLARHREQLARDVGRLTELAQHRFAARRQEFLNCLERLRLLSPEHTLARGYSITVDAADGRIVRSVHALRSGQLLRTRVRDGEFGSRVE
ncbi:MAG: exodeoxyribonuclease VII large subunit [Verrucomicrobia bacterium]|nr:exodeoxyribonuclease VII large subunit [Verrucomicrobiota bacterium]